MNDETLFAKAIRLPPGERKGFVEQNSDDVAQRQRVASLLATHDDPDSFLQPETADYSPQEERDSIIDNYKLLQELGEGGMGTVYMAEQLHPVKRRVAVKIIKAGMDSKQFVARFEAERQALAMMDHPNIARVHDGGATSQGRPYFVMELVKGVPITRFCDENKLSVQERLKLFIPVCQAVQHAHQKGIIHRDLKPSNVLVAMYDDRPVPKVIDFGVAKATNQQLTDKTLFTMVGQIVGTWEYMSPEQAVLNQLDVDTRSDVYSLGVILYELLTGVTPIDGTRLRSAALEETLRIIREEEPPKPSTRVSSLASTSGASSAYRQTNPQKLADGLKGDLDWIVMKSLDKDRKRRYESASDLGADLSRFIQDEPVEARPPSTIYRFHKFVRRNRVLAGISAAFLASLLIGLVATSQVAIAFRQKNEQIEQSLGYVKDYTLLMAMSGDPNESRNAIEIATPLVGADDPFLDIVKALSATYQGDRSQSLEILRAAHAKTPSHLSCKSLLTLNELAFGDADEYNRLANELDSADAKTAEELTMLSIAYLNEPARGLTLVERAIAIRDTPLARIHRAILYGRRAMHNNSVDDARKSVELFAPLRQRFGQNSIVVTDSLVANSVLMYLLKKRGKEDSSEYARCLDAAEAELDTIPSLAHPEYSLYARCWYHACNGTRADANKAWREALEKGPHGWLRFHAAAMLFENDDIDTARAALTGDDSLERLGFALMLSAKQANHAEVEQLYAMASSSAPIVMLDHAPPIDLLVFQSNRELLRSEARRLIDTGQFFSNFDQTAVAYLAGKRTPLELVATAQSQRLLANAHFLIGRNLLADRNFNDGIKHLKLAANTTTMETGQAYWARAFVRRIRERPESFDWLDIPPEIVDALREDASESGIQRPQGKDNRVNDRSDSIIGGTR